jgi:predicted ATP-dependent protease
VLVPAANVKHLMLNRKVRNAVAEGKFNIYAITNIDEGIELLTGIPMGKPDSEGVYLPETISGKIQRRIEKLSKIKDSSNEDEAEKN